MSANRTDRIAALRGGLIVSIQTSPQNPLHGDDLVGVLARAAQLGGAAAVRADTPEHVAIARRTVDTVVMGIYTRSLEDSSVLITPTFESASALVAAGAEIVAVDGTARPRPGGETLASIITRVHDELGVPVMADVPSVEAGVAARAAGADLIGSSVEGYEQAGAPGEPDIDLVAGLVRELDCPVIAERHYWSVAQVRAAMVAGAHAVVVGSAIVDPTAIARRFAAAIAEAS